MSKVTTVYDALVSNLATQFPTLTRIPYPYSLQDNNARFLQNGYGLKMGSAAFELHEFCNFMVGREVSVVFTKEVFRTDSDEVIVDDIVKALLENVYSVQSLFYSYNELGIEASIAKVDIISVSAVEEVRSGNSAFLSMEASFNFSIKESI